MVYECLKIGACEDNIIITDDNRMMMKMYIRSADSRDHTMQDVNDAKWVGEASLPISD